MVSSPDLWAAFWLFIAVGLDFFNLKILPFLTEVLRIGTFQ